jgi:6-phosphogluconolactonase
VRAEQPSFVAAHPQGHTIYAVHEQEQGRLSAYRVGLGAELEPLSQVSTQGSTPVHVTLDRAGQHIFAVNYLDGASLIAFEVYPDGTFGPEVARASVQRPGQPAPHAHCVTLSPDGQHVYVTDLGGDQIVCFEWGRGRSLNVSSRHDFTKGSGPRHLVIAPDGAAVYASLELSSEVAVLERDVASGTLALLQTRSTLPPLEQIPPEVPIDFKFSGANYPAEILLSADGRFVSVTNRGHDTVMTFRVGPQGHRLLHIELRNTRGLTPRGAVLSPDGDYLLTANQDTSTISLFRRDQSSGRLTFLGLTDCPTPTSLCFTRPAAPPAP